MSGSQIAFMDALGRRVRLGSWEDQKVSTYRKITEAITEQRWSDAAELGNYFVDEAMVCFSIYRQWTTDLRGFLSDKGVSADDLRAAEDQILSLLDLPDGSPFDARRQWDRFLTAVEVFVRHCHREQATQALQALDVMKETWRQCHDRDVDHTYGLMSQVKERFGEDAIGEMYQRVLLPLFAWRYDKFDVDKHPWDEGLEVLMLVACEAMRGHLVGPERTGDFELIETDDRFILRFDPCGSGQRTVRGDWVEGSPPRMEAPYNWAVSDEPRSWNHFQPGVCLYCCHCITLMEEMPMDRFGYPVRVIDPPRYPDTDRAPDARQRCQWQMFKDPTAVPEEYYARVGRTKPETFGSRAHGAASLPIVTGMPGAG